MDDCILWSKAKNKAGYGITWHNNKWAYAHRVAVNATKGQVVRHLCDNPSCVNPEHLQIGTHKENSEDMVKKHRQAFGEKAGNAKLTWNEVTKIRQLTGVSSRSVAKLFGISKTNVLDIWKNKIWKNQENNGKQKI